MNKQKGKPKLKGSSLPFSSPNKKPKTDSTVDSDDKVEMNQPEDDGSRYVTCPICNKSVIKSLINSHIDLECDAAKSSSSTTTSPPSFVSAKHVKATPSSYEEGDFEYDNDFAMGIGSGSGSEKVDAFIKQANNNNNSQSRTSSGVFNTNKKKWTPLAEKLRPSTLEDLIGQDDVLGEGKVLRSLIDNDCLPSIILWGPPGCGKTTLARIISQQTQTNFIALSAVTAGVNDIKKVVAEAKNLRTYGRRTTLFLDEIHRFNKLQQDALLPVVENGIIILIGATTENPSFEVNTALLSRCRVFVMKKLEPDHIKKILRNAVTKYNHHSADDEGLRVAVADDVIELLADVADGDARTALNVIDLCVEATAPKSVGGIVDVTREGIAGAMQKTHLLYDKKGENHYNIISALHKSLRGSDVDAALYWLGRMLEGGEDPMYVARRLMRFASEDIGMADPNALVQAVAAFQASHMVGMPECNVILAQCVVYLAKAPKSIAVYAAYNAVRDCIRNEPTPPVPLHICNAPTPLMKELGYLKGYKYTPDFKNADDAQQNYLPDALLGRKFYDENR